MSVSAATVTKSIGTLALSVSACADNGSGLIRITSTAAHGLTTGNGIAIANVVGTTEANASWESITVIDSTNFDLVGSTFTNAYTSGGDITRDYSTITLWEAALGGAAGGAGNDAVGEMYNDSVFDESGININEIAANVASIELTVAPGERHDGTEGTGARIVRTGGGQVFSQLVVNTHVKWLEIDINGNTGSAAGICEISGLSNTSHLNSFQNMIVHGVNDTANISRIFAGSQDRASLFMNCIVYDIYGYDDTGNPVSAFSATDDKAYFLNCTAHDISRGKLGVNKPVRGFSIGSLSKVKNCIATDVAGEEPKSFSTSGTDIHHNLSSDATASGTGSLTSKTAADQFVSTVSGSEDLHLKAGADAIGAGADLGTTPTGVNIDIDGTTRNGTWDIGADETAEKIYRSVGPSNTSTLATDTSHANTVTLTSGTATFSAALADNIGVGDVVIVDTAGTDQTIDSADTLLFISGRTSSTVYALQTEAGATPADITINDTYSIYRAYTSLSLAEAGTENATITGLGFSFSGGDRDLVTNNEQWNLACYGDAVDSTAVAISGWTTGANNYIKIYTPISLSEAGESQRHSGKWDSNKYYIERTTTGDYQSCIQSNDEFVRIEGIQLSVISGGHSYENAIAVDSIAVDNSIEIYSSIVKGNGSADNGTISYESADTPNLTIVNSVFYDFTAAGIYNNSRMNNVILYNNTVYNCGMGIAGDSKFVLKNNVVQNCTNGYSGTLSATSDYNISDVVGDTTGISGSYRSGLATEVSFFDEAGDDFHLAGNDSGALGAGTDLSADFVLPIAYDIDGEDRSNWCIGADEFLNTLFKFEGNVLMEGNFNFN